MSKNLNDNSQADPYLRFDLNINTCNRLPSFSEGPKGDLESIHRAIKTAGFAGIQDGDPEVCKKLNLEVTAHARVNEEGELESLLPYWVEHGYNCATIHLGWGMESDKKVHQLINYVMDASAGHAFPIYIETHRATITQDMWRTVELIKRFPDIGFNGDFSHWYTGQEMVYGGIEQKWEFIQPVFDRVKFMHARIGNPGCIQVNVDPNNPADFIHHFKEMWTRSFVGFLKSASAGDYIPFTIELLPADIYYAREFKKDDQLEEEGDRWQQAILYKDIAQECWEEAKSRL